MYLFVSEAKLIIVFTCKIYLISFMKFIYKKVSGHDLKIYVKSVQSRRESHSKLVLYKKCSEIESTCKTQ